MQRMRLRPQQSNSASIGTEMFSYGFKKVLPLSEEFNFTANDSFLHAFSIIPKANFKNCFDTKLS